MEETKDSDAVGTEEHERQKLYDFVTEKTRELSNNLYEPGNEIKPEEIKLIRCKYKHTMLNDVVSLLKSNYSSGENCSTWLTEKDSLVLRSFNTPCCILRRNGKEMVGFVIGFPFNILREDKTKHKISLITFLCVDKSIRGKRMINGKEQSWARILINSLIKYGIDFGIKNAYYTSEVTVRGSKVYEWRLWMRVITPRSARKNGFHFPSSKQRGDRTGLRDRMRLKAGMKNVKLGNCELGDYIDLCSSSNYPVFTEKQWRSLSRNYTVKCVIEKGKKVSMFCIRDSIMSIDGKISKCKYLVFFAGNPSHALRGAIVSSEGSDVLFINETLSLAGKQKILLDVNALRCTSKMYLQFHGPHLDHSRSTLLFM